MKDIQCVGVVGSGAMGAGIAQTCLAAGLRVVLYDMDRAAADKARHEILGRLARLVEKGSLPQGFVQRADGRLVQATGLVDFAPADMVIEAIVERLDAKQALFKALETVVAADAILATNTSSLSVAAIATACTDKARICGLHFFNPVPVMKLVEVIAAPATSPGTVQSMTALARALGKTPVTVKDGPGFLVNLAGRAYVTEALHAVQEQVCDVGTVDRIMRDGAGFRMGPFELMDLTGIDVNFPATGYIHQGYQYDPRLRTTTLHEQMFNAGRFGRKTGQGYHAYPQPPADDRPAAAAAGDMTLCAAIPEATEGFATLAAEGLETGDDKAVITLIAPLGEDAATACGRLGLDPATTVALDFTALARRHLTLMAPLGGAAARDKVAQWLRGRGYRVETIKDSPGFVLQRIIAMVANLGCELAQIGVGSARDIDLAMRLAQNYPLGPLEWAEHVGVKNVHDILVRIQAVTGSDRYRPSLWLRRRALLDLPIHMED